MRFLVTPDVLIPRPETELLVELALEHLQLCPAESPSILDLCTGSGCVGIAILANHSSTTATLTDLSPDAIAIAWQNAELHGVFERSQLIVGDLDSDIDPADTFDVITANPPYIDPDDIETLDIEVRDWEPELALYAPDAGYALYPRIAALALTRLRPGGLLAVECGHTQAGTIADMFTAAGLTNIKIHDDLAGIPRVVTANQL
jgi:release factor glutamine methyltransferase